MPDTPWQGDACSLVDAFRAGDRSPLEELDATLAAVEASKLNAFSHLDPDAARAAARDADVSLPFGGVPLGVKELDRVAGWPHTEASTILRDEVASFDSTLVSRLRGGGALPFGLTTSSEFGGVNFTRTHLNGVTWNPWKLDRSPGGSSGGSAAAVAGGLVTLATGGDGGGSIRIPAGFCGLPGLKATYGRIPKGPHAEFTNCTAVLGPLTRSVRDIARYFDLCNGFDRRDPTSLPRVEGWEAGLGSHLDALAGRKVAIAPNLGSAVVLPEIEEMVRKHGEALVADARLQLTDRPVALPELSYEWALSGLVGVMNALGDRYPACEPELTQEIALGMKLATQMFNLETAARVERQRVEHNEAMAALFDEVDLVIAATNPDVAFTTEGTIPMRVGDVNVGPGNNGALTIPSNIHGNPAITIPIGQIDGLPVGMQVIAKHHEEPLLLDLLLIAERERPWPLVAPGAPA
jgi:Asp-tRNA(Asn)/Glu-tRNA(Gln) amidotransferase A subunit family amidase